MRIFVFSRRDYIVLFFAFAALILTVLFCFKGIKTVKTISYEKKVPIYCVDTEKKEIAITFDAAWGNSDTDKIISILKKHNAKATFFCTGQWVSKYPDDLSKLYAMGNEIANHSDTHFHLNGKSAEQINNDITNCNKKIFAVTKKNPSLYRGPYGEYNNTSITQVEALKMFYIQWDIDSRDWQKKKSAFEMADYILKKADNGSIILFHTDTVNTPQALDLVLSGLSEKGYKFVTVSNLIYKDNFFISSSGKQYKK